MERVFVSMRVARFQAVGPPPGLRGYDAAKVSDAGALDKGGPELVQQQFGSENDVNTIVRRFGLTRELPAQVAAGVYGDFSGITDFESAVEQVARARDAFMRLPGEVREHFGNDPGKLVSAVEGMSEAEFMEAVKPRVAPVAPVVENKPA